MSDLSPTDGWNDDDVELASAYLDGELGADDVARVESDPRLVALVDSFGALGERLAVDAPDEEVVDAHVAAAMAALDDAPAGARVVQLSSERRRRWYDRIPLGAVAAAVVIVALLGAATQLDLGDDGDDTATATAADSGDDTAGSEAFAETGEALGDGAGGAGTMDAPVAATPPLEFATADALADHVSALVSGAQEESSYSRSDLDSTAGQGSDPSSDDAAGGGAAPPCDPVAAADIGSAPLLLLLPALVSGRDVTAVVVDDEGDRRLVVVDHVSCAVVDDRLL